MQNYKDLKVWEKAHSLALGIYKASREFPKEEQFSITSQIQKASISIPTNIAEGCGKFSNKDFGNFLQIAPGSSELGILDKKSFEVFSIEIGEIKGILIALIKKVRS